MQWILCMLMMMLFGGWRGGEFEKSQGLALWLFFWVVGCVGGFWARGLYK
jgi:hypothetical protein